MRIFLIIFLFLTFLGPVYLLLSGQIDFKADYRTANRDSAKLAPDPLKTQEAVVQFYTARTFNWRGIFAVHTWYAIKSKGATQYNVYQVIGWRLYHHLSPFTSDFDLPDRNWFNVKPNLLLDIRGQAAEKMIEKITVLAKQYPYANEYSYWPGPNSNTFSAFIARGVPEMKLSLPSNAVGKDFLGDKIFFAKTPSGTGYQFSLFGLFGILIASEEGIEINILGLVYGFSPKHFILKLPGFGDINFLKH